MSRHATIVAAVALVSGLVVVVAAVTTATGSGSGGWTDLLLVVAAVVFVSAIGVIAVTFVITTVLNAAAAFFIPQQPPGLARIGAVMEQWQSARDAAAARRAYERQQPDEADPRDDAEAFIAAVSTTRVRHAPVPTKR